MQKRETREDGQGARKDSDGEILMDIELRKGWDNCGDCMTIASIKWGVESEALIIIEGVWTSSIEDIENAMESLISHETIEYLIEKVFDWKMNEDLHSLIGSKQNVKDYANGETHGIVLKGKRFK